MRNWKKEIFRKVKYYYSPSQDIIIGAEHLITGRGKGVVESMSIIDPASKEVRYTQKAGESARIDLISRVCMKFQDDTEGGRLLPDGRTTIPYPSYGTYEPILDRKRGEYQWRSY